MNQLARERKKENEGMTESGDSVSPEHGHGISSISHHCILHAVHGVAPRKGISSVLPQSGSRNISSFCRELAQLVRNSSNEKSLYTVEEELVPQIVIQNFFSGVISEASFAAAVEKSLVDACSGASLELDFSKLHRICWDFYSEEKKGDISFPKWLSAVCMFRLWLVFNQCLDEGESCCMATVTLNEIIRRIIVLCSYSWNDSYGVTEETTREGAGFTYPQFLECVTDIFETLKLNTSLTAEVIADLEDEIVGGVLKKGYLEKKGHVRRNWRRRWFILKRTILSYYSTDRRVFKGEVVLNAQTKVSSLEDKGNRRNMFLVTCGATEKPFTISADDQKMKHDWMLAIRKAIALAKVEEGGTHSPERKELETALSGFFLLKYGTQQPRLHRQDSDIQHMKHHTTKRKFKKIENIAKGLEAPPTTDSTHRDGSEEDGDEKDDYVSMKPGAGSGFTSTDHAPSSSDEEDGYCNMERTSFITQVSSTSGPDTPSDSLTTFSLPSSSYQDDVFNPIKTGLKSPAERPVTLATQEEEMKRDKRGLDESFYEQCAPETIRYVPQDRYVDVRHTKSDAASNFEDSETPPKTTPTDPAHSTPQESYLTILPSPKATPPPDDVIATSPTHSSTGPPVPPRRSTSPNPMRRPATLLSSTSPPPPPPRPADQLSPLTSPVHNLTSPSSPSSSSSSPQVPSRRRISVPTVTTPVTNDSLVVAARDAGDATKLPPLKTYQSSGVMEGSKVIAEGMTKPQKPLPPPRQR